MNFSPRLPLSGNIDLTYRCNNNCLHCWLWLPAGASQQREELSLQEIERIVLEARALGCRDWSISGGEPMLREDFAEIFDFITRHARAYSLNTNGTLITPQIAQLMKRPGDKMVALYGATADIHDAVTRLPGSFEAAMRGFALLREAGAGFVVQIVPMRVNFHQLDQMTALAEKLSPHQRIGAAWLNLSACGSRVKNESICAQRLLPAEILHMDPPAPATGGPQDAEFQPRPESLLAACALRSEFHIDPYGQMSFCAYIKDPAQRYDLKTGPFRQGWEVFLPALATAVQPDDSYRANCGPCALRDHCHWCPAMARLETGSYTQSIPYLCELARETGRYYQDRIKNHTRYFNIAGLTVQMESDLPFQPHTLDVKFQPFQAQGPGEDTVVLRHHFSLPALNFDKFGREVYDKSPWQIFENPGGYIYLLVDPITHRPYRATWFNREYTHGEVYHHSSAQFDQGNVASLAMFPTDQIVLSQVLADRQGCYIHSSGVILNGKGLLFVGHSGAGKSTTLKMIRHKAQILCDDRNIIRLWPDGFHLHGTWSHGEIPEVTAGEAPLTAMLFLEKAKTNRLTRIEDPREIVRRLPFYIVKPLVTADWWRKTLDLIEAVAQQVPCYRLEFDKSGAIMGLLEQFTGAGNGSAA